MSQNGRFYHAPNVLRLCSECTPNVFRLYSDCWMHSLLPDARLAHKVFAHNCLHKCARTRSLAHGVFGCVVQQLLASCPDDGDSEDPRGNSVGSVGGACWQSCGQICVSLRSSTSDS